MPSETPITYGGYVFYRSQLYRIAGVDNPTLNGKRCWVNELVQKHGCDWLKVRLADTATNDEWLVKPSYIIPE
jgi:hypothetical protein